MNAATWRFSLAMSVLLLPTAVYAQSASFTYQGQLRQSGEPFTGTTDFEFRLYDQLSDGTQIGNPQARADWPVEDGLFQVELDFGAAAFDGSERFLEITIDGVPLSPRQKVTATPYALLASGLASGSVGSGSIDPSEVQLRVLGTCPVGEYIQEVNQDGSVVCGTDENSGGTLTQVDTGTGLTGGPITDSGTISVAPGGIGAAEIDASQVQARVSGSCPAGLFLQQVNQDGTVICAADAIGNDWRLGGNAGTNPATDFIGTSDATPFEIRTDSARSLRIEPSTETFNGSPITTNTVSGASANGVAPGVRGATISGGGVPTGDSDPDYAAENPNQVTDHYGTVGGGYGNTAGDDSGSVDDRVSATVAGGIDNLASGSLSAIGGGLGNRAGGSQSTIGGGILNTASEAESTVGGGRSNNATGRQSGVGGGEWNAASGDRSAIGGGSNNAASGPDSTIGGGSQNSTTASYSTVAGGSLNEAGGIYSALGGGSLNLASGAYSNISGGRDNEATGERSGVGGGGSNLAGGEWSRVSGGASNTADGAFSTVGGGQLNDSSGESTTVGGGAGNEASGAFSTVSGGEVNSSSRPYSTVGGGRSNTASGNSSTVAGGLNNEASGIQSAVGGGTGNCAGGTSSWAGGFRAKVRPGTLSGAPVSACLDVPISGGGGDQGTFVWADATDSDFISSGPNQFLVRASGGVAFGRTPDDYFEIQTPFSEINGNGSGEQGAFRVRLNGATRLRLLGNGGLAVGSSFQNSGVPDNGLRVAGEVRIESVNGGGSTQLCLNTSSNEIATCSSSARYKNDIQPLELGLEDVLALRPVGYRWTHDGSEDVGFVAEEVAEIDERLIHRNDRGEVEGVRYDRISALLVNATRTLGARTRATIADLNKIRFENEQLQTRLTEVEDDYESRLAALEKQQQQELSEMRQELALLRQLVAPDMAPSLAKETKR